MIIGTNVDYVCEPLSGSVFSRPMGGMVETALAVSAGCGWTEVISVRPNLPTLLSVAIVANQGAAVICQFAQSTDSRFPFLYFSVDSAVLAGVVGLLTLLGWQGEWSARLRLTSAVGVLVSAFVFAAAIAPASGTGTWFQPNDDLWVRAAAVLMHGVAPVLVTLDFALRKYADSVRSAVLWSFLWPLIYLAVLIVGALIVGSNVIPYPFLRPASMGWPTVATAVVVLTVLIGLLGAMLGVSNHACGRLSEVMCTVARMPRSPWPHTISHGPTSMKVRGRRVATATMDETPGRDDPYAGVDLFPDLARTASPWRQIVRDMYAPAPMSHWASEVTTVRIRAYDQIRPGLTRGALLGLLAILLCAAPGTWWLTFLMLVPAAVQVILEIVLTFQLAAPETTRVRALKPLVKIAGRAHSRRLVNVTGVIGVVAVPANIVAVCYLSGPGKPSWVKVLGPVP